jgi:hypothetical protein
MQVAQRITLPGLSTRAKNHDEFQSMNSPRPFLFFAVLLSGFFLWQAWQQDYAAKPAASVAAQSAATAPAAAGAAATSSPDVPSASSAAQSAGAVPATAPDAAAAPANTPSQRVAVNTDVLHAQIDTRGGSLVEAELLAYPIDPSDRSKPVRLLDDADEHYFVVQSGLVSSASAAPDHKALFSAEKNAYELAPGADSIEVPLTWHDASGVSVRKVYIFKRGSYLIDTREKSATQRHRRGPATNTGNCSARRRSSAKVDCFRCTTRRPTPSPAPPRTTRRTSSRNSPSPSLPIHRCTRPMSREAGWRCCSIIFSPPGFPTRASRIRSPPKS